MPQVFYPRKHTGGAWQLSHIHTLSFRRDHRRRGLDKLVDWENGMQSATGRTYPDFGGQRSTTQTKGSFRIQGPPENSADFERIKEPLHGTARMLAGVAVDESTVGLPLKPLYRDQVSYAWREERRQQTDSVRWKTQETLCYWN